MDFASDNWSGASGRVIRAVSDAAQSGGVAYGGDRLTKAVEAQFSEFFEREVAVFFVATGTAANALGLASLARPGGMVLCHRIAHIRTEESGATEFFSGGMKTVGVDGREGKVGPDALAAAIAQIPDGSAHHGQVLAVSVSNLTEIGTAYNPREVAAIADVAKRSRLTVHMDGARIANALAGLGCTPAELTWKAGVDILSFGGTKNGCIAADAVIFFDPAAVRDFAFARQRAGHTFSKSWFVAAQFAAYLKDGHWLELASHANAMARRLADAIEAAPAARLAVKPAGNEVFAILNRDLDRKLRDAGARYHAWAVAGFAEPDRPKQDEVLVRLVASFATRAEDVDRFASLMR